MYYIDIAIPVVLSIVAISIPQLLIKEDHPKLERRIVLIRRWAYGIIALTILYGAIRYFV